MTAAASSPARELPAGWSQLASGDRLAVIKLRPDGVEAARYPAEVVAIAPGGWVVVRARWALAAMDLDGLTLEPGDELQEWFSPLYPFNAFAVLAPEARLKGWYANITHPARLDMSTAPWQLYWHDLYVDLVGFPDGRFLIRDDDELRDSGLDRHDRALYQRIVAARAELIRRFTERLPPFVVTSPSE